MDTIKIYTLSDPITNEVRYIGQTKHSLEERLKGHLKSKEKVWRVYWIKSLKEKNLIPKIELIEEVDKSLGSQTEIYWISMFKYWGFNLTNLTDGGETSTTKNIVRSKEWGKNIRLGKLNSNFKYSEESKIKMSESAKKRGVNSKGSQLSKHNLTDEDVSKIKELIRNRGNKSLKKISEELSLPHNWVICLNLNRIWKHVQ
jgi:hypothetical protein